MAENRQQSPFYIRIRSLRMFYCGGNYNNTSNAGVFYANGNNARTNTGTNNSFRSACPHRQILYAYGMQSAQGNKGSAPFACLCAGVEMISCVSRFQLLSATLGRNCIWKSTNTFLKDSLILKTCMAVIFLLAVISDTGMKCLPIQRILRKI